MRNLVMEISSYAKSRRPGFLIIPQNGQELITLDGSASGEPVDNYIDAIDGTGREDLFYGYHRDNRPSKDEDISGMLELCRLLRNKGKTLMVIDYCHSRDKVDDSFQLNRKEGFLSFAAPNREMDLIPEYPDFPYRANSTDIDSLDKAHNFLYLINPRRYSDKSVFLEDLKQSDYDLILLDLFFQENALEPDDLLYIKQKARGGKRLIIAYMSIGEAEDYRYYWQEQWNHQPPSWLEEENPRWKGNYKVQYWDPLWKEQLWGRSDAYLDRILQAGFDGVYLDIIDGFEFFENLP